MSAFVLTNAFCSFLTLIHNSSLTLRPPPPPPAGLGTIFSLQKRPVLLSSAIAAANLLAVINLAWQGRAASQSAEHPAFWPSWSSWLSRVSRIGDAEDGIIQHRGDSACCLGRNSELGQFPPKRGIRGDTVQSVPSASLDSTATD